MSSSSNESSWGRRRSLFALSALTPMTSNTSEEAPVSRAEGASRTARTLKKFKHGRSPSQNLLTDFSKLGYAREPDNVQSAPPLSDPQRSRRPSLSMRTSMKPSVFGSLRSTKQRSESDDYPADPAEEPLSAYSTHAPSIGGVDGGADGLSPAKTVVLHGEVQTSAGMFRKKKEYLVLTETHIIRFKGQGKAAETFKTIPHPVGRSPTVRHGSMQSFGSHSDLQTLSDSSGDKDGRVPLRQVVAAQKLDDGKPHFAIEVCYLDEESGQANALTMQFGNPEQRDVWLRTIRAAVQDSKTRGYRGISAFNLENAARIIERENDYNPSNCAIFKVVQRMSAAKSAGRSSSDDLSKVASTVCFLAIGVHKVHIIQLSKPVARSSSPSLASNAPQVSYGILTLTGLKVSSIDDTFELTFRQPLQRPRHVFLASAVSHEIAARLHLAENFLRPECGHRLFNFTAPADVEAILPPPLASDEEHSCLDRTLTAYCVAYGVNPGNVRYAITYDGDDAPRFELLPPADSRRPEYGPIDLLAIMRALRYNESFGTLSFANNKLDSLNGLHDNYGHEHVCSHTKRGTPIKLSMQELGRSCLLVQEVRALAATSKKLRRMDFSGCVTSKPAVPADSLEDDIAVKSKDIGCGIVEALFPLCKHQTTNVDWVCLNGIFLSETDLDYLVGAVVEKSCHFRAIELDRCELNDRSINLILDALRAQDNTLEGLQIAGNAARINPATFDSQLGIFGFIRKLNLSYVSQTSGSEPLLQAETLLIWRLQELRLSGTTLNKATIEALGTYLAHPQSNSLHELYIDHCYLSGSDIATLLLNMSQDGSEVRDLHFDISQNRIGKELEQVTQAIAAGRAPSHLSMRAIEYREESFFRKMLNALIVNKTIRYLDMSQTALPGDASEETCRALERLLAENDCLVELDISGEDSRLATSRFGNGINQALNGLKRNKALQTFRIERQRLGIQGSSTLAEVLKENTTLRELHCGNNDIPLQGFTDLVNSLIENKTLVYLPTMDDGRAAAFRSAEQTMKGMSEVDTPVSPRSPTFPRASQVSGASAMKRGLASVRRTAAKGAAYTPSLSALPSHSRSTPSPAERRGSPLSLNLPSPKTRRNSQSPVAAPVSFTVQDIQTTHRLLNEQWDRQYLRLGQYLDRNWCLLNDVAVDAETSGDEKFERPESVGSIGKMLEQVKFDTTPRAERELYFGPHDADMLPAAHDSAGPLDEKQATSFKQFILDSGPPSPDSDEPVSYRQTKHLRVHSLPASSQPPEDPETPTQ
ncbi:hypothetical protein B0A50_03337 [Salinomyces thailandicus]|uniref:PH domain-containing protein n=1 Tax=Salinomyces thailandicus TaxID=706561 RepID=A0A4U0U3B7_9PEZI|nr:hypothetical protein B0A50_03337 [Salinomyces thailandica]